MSPATPIATPLPVGAAIEPNSLRASMEVRRARGERFPLGEAASLLVPLCVDLAQRHGAGGRFFVHPSSIEVDTSGAARLKSACAQALPTLPRDRACLPPESRGGGVGDARASVYAVGAIAYELVTGESVGPGMRRPSEIVSQVPPTFELVLGKALVTDPAKRPDDLMALASAFHALAPTQSDDVPGADGSRLSSDDLSIDVTMSMMPPAPGLSPAQRATAEARHDGAFSVVEPPAAARADATSRLADLKSRLESDPRPRYVVVQNGMDHGPFSAVELLQQIAGHTFTGDSLLRDSFSKEERTIKDWDEFAPFAEHAKLHRDIKAEKQEMERVIVAEKKATTGKAVIFGGIVGLVALLGVGWFLKARGTKSDGVADVGDRAVSVDVAGGLSGAKSPGAPGRLATQGGMPVLPGGLSCEGAQAKYVEELKIGGKSTADLSEGQFGAVLNKGTYLNACGVPSDAKVNVCAAVQNGRAVGVTVSMTPHNPGLASCVAGKVRGLSFPSSPKLDIARTSF